MLRRNSYTVDGAVASVVLNGVRAKGAVTLIDACDVDAVLAVGPWSISTHGYAQVSRPRHVSLHRLLLAPPRGYQVDHANGDRLDNRRSNLRIATTTQNMRNAAHRGGTSEFKGVVLRKGRWEAFIAVGTRQIYLGRHDCERAAALAFDVAARALHRDFARLNLPAEEALPQTVANVMTRIARRLPSALSEAA